MATRRRIIKFFLFLSLFIFLAGQGINCNTLKPRKPGIETVLKKTPYISKQSYKIHFIPESEIPEGKREPHPPPLLPSRRGRYSRPFRVSGVQFDGYQLIGVRGQLIFLFNNPDAVHPTWNQLKRFLLKDDTDKQPYIKGAFVCSEYAEMLHNNAERAGWRCAIVIIKLGPSDLHPFEAIHTLNAFETRDRGLIFIDSTRSEEEGPEHQDKMAAVSVGEEYRPTSIFACKDYTEHWGNMGKVLKIKTIQW